MDPAIALTRLGGVATHEHLLQATSRRRLANSLSDGLVVRDRRGRYRLPDVDAHVALAHECSAVLSHESAAQRHGWPVKTPPEVAQLVVPRTRQVRPADRSRAQVRWRALTPYESRGGVTTPLRTVLDCARDLPFDRALAVADSALRSGDLSVSDIGGLARAARGTPGAQRVRRVVTHASGMAANPFESVLRATALSVPGLEVRAQLRVWDHGLYATVDVGSEELKLALEGDSWAHHGKDRRAFRRDCRRYDELVAWGWTVFRFTWEDVMLHPEFVIWCLESWLASRVGGAVRPAPARLRRLA